LRRSEGGRHGGWPPRWRPIPRGWPIRRPRHGLHPGPLWVVVLAVRPHPVRARGGAAHGAALERRPCSTQSPRGSGRRAHARSFRRLNRRVLAFLRDEGVEGFDEIVRVAADVLG